MTAVEFRLRLSSMYSIRVPFSYQSARIYPLPAPSTIKGLCSNALWQNEGGNPVEIMKEIQNKSIGAAARAEHPIEVSSCTVRVVPMNALLRQFAFTPYIDCLIAFKDGEEALSGRIAESLKVSPIYLGDSESLGTVMPDSIHHISTGTCVEKGESVSVNTLVNFDLIENGKVDPKGLVLYMQDDPVAVEASLRRHLAPLRQEGDSYYPVEAFSFSASVRSILFTGKRLRVLLSEPSQTEQPKARRSRGCSK